MKRVDSNQHNAFTFTMRLFTKHQCKHADQRHSYILVDGGQIRRDILWSSQMIAPTSHYV